MFRYNLDLPTTNRPLQTWRPSRWLGIALALGLPLLLVGAIALGWFGGVHAVPPFERSFRPTPNILIVIYYGPNMGPSYKAARPAGPTLSLGEATYVFSIYVQMPERRWSRVWLM